MTDDESDLSLIQLDNYVHSCDDVIADVIAPGCDDVITPRSRDPVTDDNVADWILDHCDVTSGRELSMSGYRPGIPQRNVRTLALSISLSLSLSTFIIDVSLIHLFYLLKLAPVFFHF